MTSRIVAALLPALAFGSDHLFSVTTGRHFSFFVDKGVAYGTGRNQYGQLGLGHTEDQNSPVVVPLPVDPEDNTTFVKSVAAGAFHALFLTEGGDIWVAGRNNHGQLGDGTRTTPGRVTKLETISGVAEVAAGYAHTIFRMETGLVKAVGLNSAGQLGINSKDTTTTPVEVFFGRGGRQGAAVAIAAGYDFTYILDSNGEVWVMGQNLAGQLGLEASNPVLTAHVCLSCGFSRRVTAIAAGESHGFFVSSNVVGGGPGRCMTGANFAGQFGLSNFNPYSGVVCIADETWTVSAGGDSSCWAAPGYPLECAGNNRFGQLGVESPLAFISSGASVRSVEGSPDVSIADTHILFLNHDEVMVAGSNIYGELGDNDTANKDTATLLRKLDRPERTTTMPPPTPAPTPKPTPAPTPSSPPPVTTAAPAPAPSPDRNVNSAMDWPWEMLVGGIATGLGVVLVMVCVFDRPGAAEAQGQESTELAATA